jgi:hypothetical protein
VFCEEIFYAMGFAMDTYGYSQIRSKCGYTDSDIPRISPLPEHNRIKEHGDLLKLVLFSD